MTRKFLIIFSALGIAFSILFISVLRTAEIRYQFNPHLPGTEIVVPGESVKIEYYLPYPGGVLPDSPFWLLKAGRDRLWYLITANVGKKADLLLLFADKRLNMAIVLFERKEAEVGFTALTKAEQYLELASSKEKENRAGGLDTTEFLERLSLASLKHYQVIQYLVRLAPDDARPVIIGYETYPKKVYQDTRDALMEEGKIPPENPFNW